MLSRRSATYGLRCHASTPPANATSSLSACAVCSATRRGRGICYNASKACAGQQRACRNELEELAMPRYIIERSVPGLTREQLAAAARLSNKVLEGMPEVRWIRSYVSDVDGKIYCEYDAPSPEAVREHARR